MANKNDFVEETLEQVLIKQKLNSLFDIRPKDAEERRGLHASAILSSDNDFCYREQILSMFFKRGQGEEVPLNLKRIFKQGDVIHEKWQDMFVNGKIAYGIETRAYIEKYDLYMTPDAIIEIDDKLYVCEIKSANTFSAKHMKYKHPTGNKQIQIYMHFFGIPHGFVLVDDKNDQEIKVFPVKYEPETVRPFLERLVKINNYKEIFINKNKMPKRKCQNCNTKKALGCAMRDACFGINVERL